MSRDYLSNLQSLLPHGPAWPRSPDADLTKLLLGLVPTLQNVDDRVSQLLAESDPRETDGLLARWEWALALQSDGLTLAERRRRIISRLQDQATPSVTDIKALGALWGIDVEVELFDLATCESPCDVPVRAELWLWVWLVRPTTSTHTPDHWAVFVSDVRHVAPPYTLPIFTEV